MGSKETSNIKFEENDINIINDIENYTLLNNIISCDEYISINKFGYMKVNGDNNPEYTVNILQQVQHDISSDQSVSSIHYDGLKVYQLLFNYNNNKEEILNNSEYQTSTPEGILHMYIKKYFNYKLNKIDKKLFNELENVLKAEIINNKQLHNN